MDMRKFREAARKRLVGLLKEKSVPRRASLSDGRLPDPMDRAAEQQALSTEELVHRCLSSEREKILYALRRIEEGTYEFCEGCGEKIPLLRLEILPYATHCVECQEKQEKEEAADQAARAASMVRPAPLMKAPGPRSRRKQQRLHLQF